MMLSFGDSIAYYDFKDHIISSINLIQQIIFVGHNLVWFNRVNWANHDVLEAVLYNSLS